MAEEKAPAQPPLPSLPGFDILERLGEGGFGAVYRARDLKLDRLVAVKLLRPGAGVDPQACARFLAEARTLARVRHPGVLQVYAALDDPATGSIALVTELIEGATLSEHLEDHGPLAAEEAARVGVEMCRALAAVHAAGIVHRDVKTLNILRERGGRLVLADFGLGVVLAEGRPADGGAPAAGSPLFMAPEQVRGEPVTPQTDLYALGVLLYHLSSGKFPVTTFALPALLGAIARGELRPLRDARADLPESFVQVVTRALERDPKDRFPSAGAMEQALLEVLAGTPGSQAALETREASRETSSVARSRPSRRGRLVAWSAALLAAAALAIAVSAALHVGPFAATPAPIARARFWLDLEEGPRPLENGQPVSVGAPLYLTLETLREVHVYVLGEDAKGEVHALFPRADSGPQNPLAGGKSHRLPSTGEDWAVSSTGGRETLLVLASAARIEPLEEAARRETLSSEEAGRVLRGIGKVVARPSASGEARPMVREFIERLEASGQLPRPGESALVSEGLWVSTLQLENP